MSPHQGKCVVSEGNKEGAGILFRCYFAQCVSRFAGIDFFRILSSMLRRSMAPASESRSRAQTIPSTVLGPSAFGVITTVANDSLRRLAACLRLHRPTSPRRGRRLLPAPFRFAR